jgi:L-lactate utilization protein LutB
MEYTQLASSETITKVSENLRARNIEPIVVADRAAALAAIKTLIPKDASVMSGLSMTLEEIGYMKYLEDGQHGWNNLRIAINAAEDAVVRAKLRKEATLSDYYLGSVHALSENGELVIASGTGSQLPNIVYDSANVIFVVGAQKIVPTLADAMHRLEEHVIPLENARMMEKYGKGTALGKIVIFDRESELNGRKIRLILVNEALGF